MDLVVRASELADLQAIQSIYAHHVLHGLASFEEAPPDVFEIGVRRERSLRRGLPHLVAADGTDVVGFAHAAPYRERAAYRFTVESTVYVAQDHARRGIGRRLLQALIEGCDDAGVRQMIAVIGDRHNRPSIALHETLGFSHAGVLVDVGFKFGRWVDSVIMQRSLETAV